MSGDCGESATGAPGRNKSLHLHLYIPHTHIYTEAVKMADVMKRVWERGAGGARKGRGGEGEGFLFFLSFSPIFIIFHRICTPSVVLSPSVSPLPLPLSLFPYLPYSRPTEESPIQIIIVLLFFSLSFFSSFFSFFLSLFILVDNAKFIGLSRVSSRPLSSYRVYLFLSVSYSRL